MTDTQLIARLEAAEKRLAEAEAVIAEMRATPYAPWTLTDDKGNVVTDPDDTLGAMIDNQAWVLASHLLSFIGHRDGDEDMMEDFQEAWAINHKEWLSGWFSPHRAMARYLAEVLTIRPVDQVKIAALRAKEACND